MKTLSVVLFSVLTVCIGNSLAFDIESFHQNGELSWYSWPNEGYRVEWASELDGANTEWHVNWEPLEGVIGEIGTTTAAVPMFYRVVRINQYTLFDETNAWDAYEAGSTDGLSTKGYTGGVFDGRYAYFVPYIDGATFHGRVMRYDTQGSGFKDAGNWDAYDAGGTDGMSCKGYIGAVFDGTYVYFSPDQDAGGRHGRILRYDTTGPGFKDAASWDAYDADNTDGLYCRGYAGVVYDGRYAYFVPSLDDSKVPHAQVLRYDTHGPGFTNALSWSAYDAGSTGGFTNGACRGGSFDGRYVYFSPSGYPARHGVVLRYDTQGDFTSSASWSACDAGLTDGLTAHGYLGSVYDGRYVHFMPERDNGIALRYDTQGDFTNAASWDAHDIGTALSLGTKGFYGGVFDGRHVYYAPNSDASSWMHGDMVRYDTYGTSYVDAVSWDTRDCSSTDGLDTVGYISGVFDGQYIYFVPWRYNPPHSVHHGRVLRFNARQPPLIPDTVYGGSFY